MRDERLTYFPRYEALFVSSHKRAFMDFRFAMSFSIVQSIIHLDNGICPLFRLVVELLKQTLPPFTFLVQRRGRVTLTVRRSRVHANLPG